MVASSEMTQVTGLSALIPTMETDDGDQDNLARGPTLDDKAETSTRTHNDGVDLIDETVEIEGACVDHLDDVDNQEHDPGSVPKNINKLW